MMLTRPHAVLIGAAGAALALASCAESGDTHANGPHDDTHDHASHEEGHEAGSAAVRTDVYEGILGEIVAMPAGDENPEMRIRHQQIPGFKNEAGEVPVTPDGIPGMRSMQMPFPVAQGVSLGTLAVGDKVRFSFRVNWGGSTPWELTAIEKLDPDTEIDYSNSRVDETQP